MAKTFQPLLSGKAPDDLSALKRPVFVSPKLDGIRCVVKDGQALTRKLKLIPNRRIQGLLGNAEFDGLDGELTVGEPNAVDTWNATQSGVMSHDGEPVFTFHVFDDFTDPGFGFEDRLFAADSRVRAIADHTHGITLVHHELAHTVEDVMRLQDKWVSRGYEGVMLRSPFGAYKFGRSTLREGHLIKVKRFEDGEAIVQDFVEKYYNRNEPIIDALGLQKRSSSIEGKVPAGVLGAFVVRDVTTGLVFEIGSGLDDYWRSEVWNNKEKYKGSIIKYKYQPYGVKELPRSPIFLGFRDPIDM